MGRQGCSRRLQPAQAKACGNILTAVLARDFLAPDIGLPGVSLNNSRFSRLKSPGYAEDCMETQSSLLTGGVVRTPVGYTDLDVKTGKIVHIRTVEKSHAWKDVPTPEI
jgi:hypothetical protein